MSSRQSPTQALLILALAVSMSVVGVYTPAAANGFVARASKLRLNGEQAAANTPRKPCCCGTADGRCCGKGCCMQQTPDQAPPILPSPSGSNKHETQFLALATALVGSAALDLGERSACSLIPGGHLTAATLQLQHVRIQT